MSVTRVLCDKTKQCTADILVGDAFFRLKFALKLTHPLETRRLRQIFPYNVSTVRDSENVQL